MSIGFKEWTLVCEEIAAGRQSIIIRKGGIAEGRAGFRFQHPEFFLFPTLFHEQAAKLKLPPGTALPATRADGQHEIRLRARAEWTEDVSDSAALRRLAPFHIWQDSEIERRFHYQEEKGKSGVSVAFIRAEILDAPFVFPDSPKYGGCKSWIELPEFPAAISARPALDDAAHKAREMEIRAALR